MHSPEKATSYCLLLGTNDGTIPAMQPPAAHATLSFHLCYMSKGDGIDDGHGEHWPSGDKDQQGVMLYGLCANIVDIPTRLEKNSV